MSDRRRVVVAIGLAAVGVGVLARSVWYREAVTGMWGASWGWDPLGLALAFVLGLAALSVAKRWV